MRLRNKLSILAFLTLSGITAQAQVKDMPAQAEFDPILENAEKKLTDFVATLAEFRVEAGAIDRKMLVTDLKSVEQLQKMIQVAHSGSGETKGVNMQRLVGILSGLDDMALDAATWKSLVELHLCQQILQHQNPNRYDQFGTRVTINLAMLREVGGQLFHPTFRAAAAADEIILVVADGATNSKAKPH
jgi:hypothetical protein